MIPPTAGGSPLSELSRNVAEIKEFSDLTLLTIRFRYKHILEGTTVVMIK